MVRAALKAWRKRSGLASRSDLMVDLESAVKPDSPPGVLAVLRLQGLSRHTELHGTLLRDQLLEEARQCALDEVQMIGNVYLTRHDELCVLLDGSLEEAIGALDRLGAAVNKIVKPHQIFAEAGVALLPEEAEDPIGALVRADRRIVQGEYTGRERRSSDRSRRRGEISSRVVW